MASVALSLLLHSKGTASSLTNQRQYFLWFLLLTSATIEAVVLLKLGLSGIWGAVHTLASCIAGC